MKYSMAFVLAFAGCGGVVPAGSSAAEPEVDGAAGAGAGGRIGEEVDGGSAGAAGTSPDARTDLGASPEAACAAPTLSVSWTLAELGTGAPATCASLGLDRVEVRVASIGAAAGFPISASLPCADGGGTIALPPAPAGSTTSISWDVDASSPSFGDARAAWSVAPSVGSYAAGCGASASGATIRIVVGAPPSCSPCAAADRCCATPPFAASAGMCASAGGRPATFASTCEGSYGPARADAISACASFLSQLCPGA